MFKKFRLLFGAQDMTQGNPLGVMMRFAVPLLIGNIAQLAYNFVNAIVVGRMVNSNALSAVGAAAPIQQLFFVFFMTVGTGVSVMIAQYFGAKDKDNFDKTVGTAITATLIVTVFITLIGIPCIVPILNTTKVTDPEMFRFAREYLFIMFLGTVGNGFYNVLSGILRGMGEAVFPLFVLIGTSILNVVLVLFFVGVVKMEVAGAALATIICQYLSAAACLIRLMKMKNVTITRELLRPKKEILKRIARIGLPSGVQQCILSVSSMFVQSLINSVVIVDPSGVALTTVFTAINAAITQVDQFSTLPNQAFSMAGSTFAGQNIGAGRLDRVRLGFKIILTTSLVVSGALVILISIFSGNLISLFVDVSNPNRDLIIHHGIRMQRIMVWCYLATAFTQSSSGVLRGAGDTMPMMIITIIGTVGMRMPMAYIMVRSFPSETFPAGNPAGVYWSMLICFSLVAIASFVYYLTGRWKSKAFAKAAGG